MKEVLVKLGISPNQADLFIQAGAERFEAKHAERKAARAAKGNDGAFSYSAISKTPAQRVALKAAKLEKMAAKAQAEAEPAPKAKKSKKNPS